MSEFLKNWANETTLVDESKLRDSKYQRKILEIQAIIRALAENPTPEETNKLVHLNFIKCTGSSRYVSHCRYLQNRVKWILYLARLNEGQVETLVSRQSEVET